MTTTSALRFSGVTKHYKKALALSGLSFLVEPGECFALAGVNGAGKTTLLKCMLDLCDLDAGSIEIFGVSHRLPRARAEVASCRSASIRPTISPAAIFSITWPSSAARARIASKFAQTLAALDLDTGAINKPARLLSKGMTQKLRLASCLLSKKQLLILDEPLSGLDPRARAQAKELLKQRKSAGATLFFTSHALNDIEELADRMVILHEGALRFHGAPALLEKAYHAPDLEQAFLRCIG